MIGITYYPQKGRDKIIQKNLQSIEVKSIEDKYSFEDAWDELIELEYGDRYFIINQDMHDFTERMIAKIKNGELKKEDFLYDYPKLFDLFSCNAYLQGTYKTLKLNDLDSSYLTRFLDNIVMTGVNLEEFKMVVLAGNLLNIDAMFDQGQNDSILKGKYEFTGKIIELVDMYRRFMPYINYFRKVDNITRDTSKENKIALEESINSFDEKMLENISQCRIKNCILKGLFNARNCSDDNVKNFMNTPILSEFFEKRDESAMQNRRVPEMFKYLIDEEGLYFIDDLCKGNLPDAVIKNIINVFKDENLISQNDFNEYMITKLALGILEENEVEHD